DMPPASARKPTAQELETINRWLDAVVFKTDCTGPKDPGRVTIRRLNRAEYNNTIRDLLGVDFKPAADFPADDVGYGFDNIGDVLSVSPLLLEKYLSAAEAILEEAIVIAKPLQPIKNKRGINYTKGSGNPKKGGGFFLFAKGEFFSDTNFDEGDHIIQAEVSAQQFGDEPVRGVIKVGQKEVTTFELKDNKPVKIQGKISLKVVTQRV